MFRDAMSNFAKMLSAAAIMSVQSTCCARPPNYDESKVAPYTLEDPLAFADGRKLKSAAEWPARRSEILDIFAREMYGQPPPPPETVETELVEEGGVLDGLGIRRQYKMWFKADRSGPAIDWVVFLPNMIQGLAPGMKGKSPVCENRQKVPVILFLNYRGNQELATDPEVLAPEDAWVRNDARRHCANHRIDAEKTRGMQRQTNRATVFPLETILARGYAVMSACYAQVSPDVEERDVKEGTPRETAYTGVFSLWPARDPARDDNVTAIGAWAWALSRGLDLAARIPEIDAGKSVATGCSRLGKTALLAAARDERFAVCVPNQTGGGGVPLAKRDYGENVSTEMAMFHHWYCKAYGKYVDNEQAMRFDQHLLVAAIAPRRILVQGFNSGWFDTKGEFLSCRAASAAWEFLGLPGLPAGDFPDNYDTGRIGAYLGYVRRGGRHGISGYDWMWMLNFADSAFGRR